MIFIFPPFKFRSILFVLNWVHSTEFLNKMNFLNFVIFRIESTVQAFDTSVLLDFTSASNRISFVY